MGMPRICEFAGVTVYMYYRDHAPPQRHVIYVRMKRLSRSRANESSTLDGPVCEPLINPRFFAMVVVDPIASTVGWPSGADLAPEGLTISHPGKIRNHSGRDLNPASRQP